MTTDIEILVVADSDVPAHVSEPGHVFATGVDISVGHLSIAGAQNLAFAARFRAVPIPKGARIRSATLRLEAAATLAEVVVNARIDGLLTPNSETPTHAEFDGGVVGAVNHGRVTNLRTRAQALWSGIAATTNGVDFDTADFSLVIQEIISQREWVEGNAMTLFVGDEDQESDQDPNRFRTALRSGVGPRLIVSFATSEDPATYEVSLGAVPQGLARATAEALRRGTQAEVE